jgi:membrane protein
VWELTKTTVGRWNEIDASSKGASLAFYALLSAAPLLVLCMGIAALILGRQAAESQIISQLQNYLGPEGGKTIHEVLANATKPAASIIATAVGTVMLLFGASSLFVELRDSLNKIWRVHASSSGLAGMIRERLFSFALVLGVGLFLLILVLASTVMSAAGKFFGSILSTPGVLLHLANLGFSLIVVTILFALLYKIVPEVAIKWTDVWIGAAVTALLFSVGKLLIGLYLGKVSVGSAYGAAGSLLVFLVWVYYSAMIFFLGAEFTRAFAERHGSRASRRLEAGRDLETPGRTLASELQQKLDGG